MATDDHGDGVSSDPGFDFRLYRYSPSLPAAIVSVVVFALLTAAHVWRISRTRAFYFTAFTIGGLCKHTITIFV
jgi:hypothetical protein